MATLAQLQAEPWWGREIVTLPMVGLALELRGAYGTGPDSIGVKGNERHLNGGHRSQDWIKNSAYCTNRTYATQSNLTDNQLRYCAALDFTPGTWGSADNRAKMQTLTARMITAMKAGRCDEVLEVFGTLNGTSVTGWRNDLNVVVTSDSSHLDHLHIRFDRRFANDNAAMSKVSAILLEDDMTLIKDDPDAWIMAWRVQALVAGRESVAGGPTAGEDVVVNQRLNALAATVAKLTVPVPAPVDIDALAAALAPHLEAAAEAAVRKVLGAVDES